MWNWWKGNNSVPVVSLWVRSYRTESQLLAKLPIHRDTDHLESRLSIKYLLCCTCTPVWSLRVGTLDEWWVVSGGWWGGDLRLHPSAVNDLRGPRTIYVIAAPDFPPRSAAFCRFSTWPHGPDQQVLAYLKSVELLCLEFRPSTKYFNSIASISQNSYFKLQYTALF